MAEAGGSLGGHHHRKRASRFDAARTCLRGEKRESFQCPSSRANFQLPTPSVEVRLDAEIDERLGQAQGSGGVLAFLAEVLAVGAELLGRRQVLGIAMRRQGGVELRLEFGAALSGGGYLPQRLRHLRLRGHGLGCRSAKRVSCAH